MRTRFVGIVAAAALAVALASAHAHAETIQLSCSEPGGKSAPDGLTIDLDNMTATSNGRTFPITLNGDTVTWDIAQIPGGWARKTLDRNTGVLTYEFYDPRIYNQVNGNIVRPRTDSEVCKKSQPIF
jgi:hypothetical protein